MTAFSLNSMTTWPWRDQDSVRQVTSIDRYPRDRASTVAQWGDCESTNHWLSAQATGGEYCTGDAQLRSSQEQQRGMQPPANHSNYFSVSIVTPFRGRSDTPSRLEPRDSTLGPTSSYVRQWGGGDTRDLPINPLRARHSQQTATTRMLEFSSRQQPRQLCEYWYTCIHSTYPSADPSWGLQRDRNGDSYRRGAHGRGGDPRRRGGRGSVTL
jgi:hypothetical protein